MESDKLVLLSADEQARRLGLVRQAMDAMGIDSALIAANANLYYLTGRVYSGYLLLAANDERPVYLVKRPVHLRGQRVIHIHKPENILTETAALSLQLGAVTGMELGRLPYNTVTRLARALGVGDPADAGAAIDTARSTKTADEVELIRQSGLRHARVYSMIPGLYDSGMTDVELQIEIERLSRIEGCMGQFRIAGDDMELHMGNVLAGDNADAPSPYDFAMGGAGMGPSLPVGANGTVLRPGMTVMVDMNGNYTGYMTDMTRTYAIGHVTEQARDAHRLSIDICHALARAGRPGVEAKELYGIAAQMAREAGLEHLFMGHRQHAGFVGHGIGIEVNEQPVLAPRSRAVLRSGNVIAIEPKFVIPGTGAVGIENTYVVRQDGPMQCLTQCDEELTNIE